MTKLIAWMIALAPLSGNVLLAQEITGTWQGTLRFPRQEQRNVFKITKADGGSLRVVMYGVDEVGDGLAGSAMTLQDSTVQMLIPGIGATYEGKLNADGTLITGTWTQQSRPFPLNLTRATSETSWTIPKPPARPKPMPADADPMFEVATIKPSRPEARGKGFSIESRRFSGMNNSVSDLITYAYGINPRQLTSEPAWLERDKYDLTAPPGGEGQPSDKQWRTMVQKLLADRFRLSFHREKKELPAYLLAVGKTGPKLVPNAGNPDAQPSIVFGGRAKLMANKVTMADFAGFLGEFGAMEAAALDRPVLDHTGIAGKYDFMLTWRADDFQFPGPRPGAPPPPDNATALPDLFIAIQEQLGLKLESTKGPVEIFVIDHVERPSEN